MGIGGYDRQVKETNTSKIVLRGGIDFERCGRGGEYNITAVDQNLAWIDIDQRIHKTQLYLMTENSLKYKPKLPFLRKH